MRSILAVLTTVTAITAMATTYRWVDAEGKVHYGDVLPSQSTGLGHQELDKQGRVIRETPRTLLTPEERRHRSEESTAREEHLRRVEEQQRRDRALLSTYANEGEIDLARDRALELENLTMKGLQTRLDNSAAKLAYANVQLSRYRAANATGPASIIQMRDEAQAELAQIGEAMRQREKTINDLKLRFEADRTRYLELMELKAMVRQ